jgi:two-component system cell cycle response regulator
VPARILVIDDNRANLDLMVYLLEAFGHTAEGVADSRAGLEAARNKNYDAIITDILMPELDGYAIARSLKEEGGLLDTPVIAVTALAMAGDREHILSAGFDGYIPKPIEPHAFVKQIDAYLPEHLRSKRA